MEVLLMAEIKLKNVLYFYIDNLIDDLNGHTPNDIWEKYDCKQYNTALRLRFIHGMSFDDINSVFTDIDGEVLTFLIDWFYEVLASEKVIFHEKDYKTYLKIITKDKKAYELFQKKIDGDNQSLWK